MSEVKFDDDLLRRLHQNDPSVTETYTLPQEYAELLGLQSDTVQFLNLDGYSLGDDDMERLSRALQSNTTVQLLVLDDNKISDNGAEQLAHALQNNTALRILYLCDNNIGENGAEHLARALQNNTTLRGLDFNNNKIGDNGAFHLALALRNVFTLRALGLVNNNIGDNGAEHLACALQNNTTLRILYLENNSIGSSGKQHLEFIKHRLELNRQNKQQQPPPPPTDVPPSIDNTSLGVDRVRAQLEEQWSQERRQYEAQLQSAQARIEEMELQQRSLEKELQDALANVANVERRSQEWQDERQRHETQMQSAQTRYDEMEYENRVQLESAQTRIAKLEKELEDALAKVVNLEQQSQEWLPEFSIKAQDDNVVRRVAELGKGGFGRVHKAELHLYQLYPAMYSDRRPITVALKEVLVGVKYEGKIIELDTVQREINNMRRTVHRNVVQPCYARWEPEDSNNSSSSNSSNGKVGKMYIAMEMMQCSLKDLAHKKLVDASTYYEQLLWMLCEIASGLEFMHGKNMIHRDLKPENVLVNTVNGRITEVKLADLGVSTVLYETVHATTECGTLDFMAPEVLSGEYTNAVDLYAFGMMLSCMVVGHLVKPLRMRGAALVYALQDKYPGMHMSSVRTTLMDVYTRCTLQDAMHRPSAADVVQVLNKIVPTRI